MANSSKQPRSFNTIRKSQTKERAKRGRISRIVLLAIIGVTALLLLAVLLFGTVSGVAGIVNLAQGCRNDPQGGGDDFPNATVQYTDATVQLKDTKIGDLILVNAVTGDMHKFEYADDTEQLDLVPARLETNDLVNQEAPFKVQSSTTKMNRVAFEALKKMLTQYYILTGDNNIGIPTNYAYRSSTVQGGYSAPAGYADHQTGYCVALATVDSDNNYTHLTDLEHWVYQNCHKYGFILRYPEGKDQYTGIDNYNYCLRYVGVAHATYIKANNLCLEEYVALLQANHTFGNALSITGVDGKFYQVYYVPVTTDPDGITTYQLPSNYEYSLSGDNDGGYIVTVHLSHPKA